MADGASLPSTSFAFRLGKSTVCEIFKETCEVLWDVLQPLYMKPPDTPTYKTIAQGFYEKWQFPNCIGCIDGKHVTIKAPNNSGSNYFNYKKTFSIILFAVCDANYLFTHVDIGSYGAQSDGGILKESEFGKALNNGTLGIPDDAYLPGTNIKGGLFFVGDEAFPLQQNLMRPYSGRFLEISLRIFNYRLSRARRCIENAFGILASRWRIFHKTIFCSPTTVDSLIKATVCLHNFIKLQDERTKQPRYCYNNYVDKEDILTGEVLPGEWRKEIPITSAIQPVACLGRRLGCRNAKINAITYRDKLKDYVNSNEGSVPWQNKCIT